MSVKTKDKAWKYSVFQNKVYLSIHTIAAD